MKKILLAVFLIALVGVAGCSKDNSKMAPESFGVEYTPQEVPLETEEILSLCLSDRGESALSLQEVADTEEAMLSSIPADERERFSRNLTGIKLVLTISNGNGMYAHDGMKRFVDMVENSFPEGAPENTRMIAQVSGLHIVHTSGQSNVAYKDVLPSIRKRGLFFSESERKRFGKYLGW